MLDQNGSTVDVTEFYYRNMQSLSVPSGRKHTIYASSGCDIKLYQVGISKNE